MKLAMEEEKGSFGRDTYDYCTPLKHPQQSFTFKNQALFNDHVLISN